MTPTRRFWALPALAFVLMLGACSTPENLTAPMLEPQFGTADDEGGVDVAFVSTGRIYSLSEQTGTLYEDYGNGPQEDGSYKKSVLRRYDGSGKLVWTKEIDSMNCTYDMISVDGCGDLATLALRADLQGNTYSLGYAAYSGGDCVLSYGIRVDKRDASGNQRAWVLLGSNGGSFGETFSRSIAMNVDASGNIYAGFQAASVDPDECTSSNRRNIVAKYSTSGSLLWQRVSTVGTPTDITVSSSGSVYVVGDKGMARYTNSGNLTWTKPGNFEQVMISGSNIYTRYRKDIRKYDGTGKQLWYKAQSGLKTLVLQDMVGDAKGNIYLSGKYEVSGPDWNAMTRKLNSSGSVLWTKTYGTPAYDDAKGIATIDGSEVYTTGLTKGSLAHTNIGGEDGYIRKLNSTGNPLWTR